MMDQQIAAMHVALRNIFSKFKKFEIQKYQGWAVSKIIFLQTCVSGTATKQT